MTSESVAIKSRRLSGSTRALTTCSSSARGTGSKNTFRPPEPTCGTPRTPVKTATAIPSSTWKPNNDPDPEVTAVTLTINDTKMTSDQTARKAPSGHDWEVSRLPGQLLDRNAAIVRSIRG